MSLGSTGSDELINLQIRVDEPIIFFENIHIFIGGAEVCQEPGRGRGQEVRRSSEETRTD